MTPGEFGALALAQPETAQASHFGKPDFRVRGKIFAGLDLAQGTASLKLPKELQALLLAARPEAFVPAAGAWGDAGWTLVILEQVVAEELHELVAAAWQQVAPARLVAQHAPAGGAAHEAPRRVAKKAPRSKIPRKTARKPGKAARKPAKAVAKAPRRKA